MKYFIVMGYFLTTNYNTNSGLLAYVQPTFMHPTWFAFMVLVFMLFAFMLLTFALAYALFKKTKEDVPTPTDTHTPTHTPKKTNTLVQTTHTYPQSVQPFFAQPSNRMSVNVTYNPKNGMMYW